MNYFWLIGQSGIVLEVFGAAYIVYSALMSRKEMKGLTSTMDGIGESVDKLISVASNQFNRELVGFLFLAIGLSMQFLGGFGKST